MNATSHLVRKVPDVSSPDVLRNVVLVGPSGSGKSALFERLTGVAPRDADDQERSTGLRAAAIGYAAPGGGDDLAMTFLDTPGHPDFVGEVRAGLRAADAAIFVVSAVEGLDAPTRALWHECNLAGTPRAIALVNLDRSGADFAQTLAACQAHFGSSVQPIGVPVGQDNIGGTTAIADLALGEIHDYSGASRVVRLATAQHAPAFDTYRGSLIEAVIEESEDDTLMDRYLGGEDVDFATLERGLLTAVSRGSFHPVVAVSKDTGAGIDVLLHLVAAAFPPPTLRPLPVVTDISGTQTVEVAADPRSPLTAEVVRTTSDPYLGHVSLVRVFAGTLTAAEPVHVSGHLARFDPRPGEGHADHDEDVRPGQIGLPLGEDVTAVEQAIAGQIVVVTKLGTAQTLDTISSVDHPLLITPWALPEALLPVAIKAASRGDDDKLPGALREVAAEDPALVVEHSAQTGQVVLWVTGRAQLDLLLERLRDRHRVDVTTEPVKVALRETFTRAGAAQGRHVKQSGGHGQFAVVSLEVTPLPPGSGVEFTETVVGGSVPRQFISSVEKGVRQQLENGLLFGWPVVDVRVTLTEGKAHSVDSSDMAFQTAGALALRELASPETMGLLEPVDLVRVTVDDEYLGTVMTDLSTRRGQIMGTDAAGEQEGRTVLTAAIPQLELVDYAIGLRSLAHGTGTFTRELHGYQAMPDREAQKASAAVR
ncbi:elongation factor G [Kribbia dieselivorans]|uniref:elongation factor G n=1 Tax=Kribbia dieselivorans TaxID=331526 RepID=UPI0008382A47|nr:elongation factor G [Kribbia dieselivorans]